MGKKIIITGADFSSVKIDGGSPSPTPTPTVVTSGSVGVTFQNNKLNSTLRLNNLDPAFSNEIVKVEVTITGGTADVGNIKLLVSTGTGSYPSFVTDATATVDTMLTVDREMVAAILTRIAEPGNASLMIQSASSLSAEVQAALASATITVTFYNA